MCPSSKHTFPGGHILQIVNVARRFGVTPDALLAGTGLNVIELEDPNTRVSPGTYTQIAAAARRLTGEPGLGVYLGLQKRLAMYGHVGFASMSAATIRESLELLVRYAPTVSTVLTFELEVGDKTAVLIVHEHADLGESHDIAALSFVVGLRQLATLMLGSDPGPLRVDLPFSRPGYFDRFTHLLPEVRFDQSKTRVSFPAAALDLPLVAPDRAALRIAATACEQQLAELGFDQRVSDRVRRLAITPGTVRSVEHVAKALGLSARTLKRRLAEEGASYSDLVTEERRTRALALLRLPDVTLEDLAHQLGYASVTNFARAFRRWTGQSPAHYRKHGR